MTTLTDIQVAAQRYSVAREMVAELVGAIEAKTQAIMDANLKDLRKLVAAAREREAALEHLITVNPALFDDPRTQIFHNIKVGFRKGCGSLDWDDDAEVVKRIEKLFPEMADALVRVEKSPVKKALQELPAADLKRLGVTVEETGDVVVIKPVDSAVDKIVKALLKKSPEEMS